MRKLDWLVLGALAGPPPAYIAMPPLHRPRPPMNQQATLPPKVEQPAAPAEVRGAPLPSTRPPTRVLPAEFYVSAAGSDQNDGLSPQSPWQTTANISRTGFIPGDHIRFKAGDTVYGSINISACGRLEGMLPQSRGLSINPIVFESYELNDGVVTASESRATIASGDSKGFYAGCMDGITIQNLRFVGSRPDDGVAPPATFNGPVGHNGILFWVPKATLQSFRGFKIDNVEVSNYWHAGLLWSVQPISGADNSASFGDIDIGNSDFHDNLRSGIETWGSGQHLENFFNLRVHHSKAHHNPGTSRNNLDSHSSGSGIVIGNATWVTIDHNLTYANSTGCIAGCGFGIWTWLVKKVLIEHNESFGNHTSRLDGGGIDIDGGTDQALVQYNYTHDNGAAGYLICNFENNYVGDVIMRFNVSENDGLITPGGAGLTVLTQNWYAQSEPDSPRWSSGSIDVYRNTFYSGKRLGYDLRKHDGMATTSYDPGSDSVVGVFADNPRDVVLRNNIFYADNTLAQVVAEWRGAGRPVFVNNAYYSPHGTRITWIDQSFSSLKQFRQWTGYTQESEGPYETGFEGNPQLKAPGKAGTVNDIDALGAMSGPMSAYSLAPTSPLIDLYSGLNSQAENAKIAKWGILPSSQVITDFFGQRSLGGAYEDIGIFENDL